MKTFAEVAAFVALMLLVGRRVFPWLLWQVTKTGSRELFTLAVVVAAVTIAYGSSLLFGVSFALGAFFAGMVLRESSFSHRAAEETLPLRDAFAVLFFVSVGMLFDPAVLVEAPLQRAGGRGDHRRRQVGGGGGAGAGLRLSAAHRPHGLGGPGADRRVLVHPRRPGRVARPAVGGRTQPGRRRRADLDRPESAAAFASSGRSAAGSAAGASGPAGAITRPTRSPSCRCRPTRGTCRSRSCSSATAGSASASPPS